MTVTGLHVRKHVQPSYKEGGTAEDFALFMSNHGKGFFTCRERILSFCWILADSAVCKSNVSWSFAPDNGAGTKMRVCERQVRL